MRKLVWHLPVFLSLKECEILHVVTGLWSFDWSCPSISEVFHFIGNICDCLEQEGSANLAVDIEDSGQHVVKMHYSSSLGQNKNSILELRGLQLECRWSKFLLSDIPLCYCVLNLVLSLFVQWVCHNARLRCFRVTSELEKSQIWEHSRNHWLIVLY